jgi:hypothetical protein
LDVALPRYPLQAGSLDLSGIQGGFIMLAQGRDGLGKTVYERHQPEQRLFYQLVEVHYPALVSQLSQQGKSLPDHVHREFEAYLKCGHPAINSGRAAGFWKEIFPTVCRLLFLYFRTLWS